MVIKTKRQEEQDQRICSWQSLKAQLKGMQPVEVSCWSRRNKHKRRSSRKERVAERTCCALIPAYVPCCLTGLSITCRDNERCGDWEWRRKVPGVKLRLGKVEERCLLWCLIVSFFFFISQSSVQ